MATSVNVREERIELTTVDKGSEATVRRVQGAWKDLHGSMHAVNGMLATIGVTVSAGAMIALAGQVTKATAALDDMSESSGASVENLSRLQTISRIGSHDFGGLSDTMGRMIKGLKGANEEGQAAARGLSFLGIQARENNARFRDTGDILFDLSKKLAIYEDGGNKMALVQDVLGKGAERYLPLLKDMAEEGEVAARVTARQAAEAEKLEKTTKRLIVVFDDAKRELVQGMIPALTDLIQKYTDAARAAGGFWNAVGVGLFGGGAANPLERLGEIDLELKSARAGQSSLAGIFTMGAAPAISGMRESILLNEREVIFARMRRARGGLAEDAAGNVGPAPAMPRERLNYQTADPAAIAKAAREAEEARKRMVDAMNAVHADAMAAANADAEIIKREADTLREIAELQAKVLEGKISFIEDDPVHRRDFGVGWSAGATLGDLREIRTEEDALWRWRIDQAERYNNTIAAGAERNRDVLAQTITDGIMRGFERGEGIFENFRETIRRSVLTIGVQPVVLGISQAMAAPFAGMAQGATTSLIGRLGIDAVTGGSMFPGASSIAGLGGFAGTIGLDAAAQAALIESGTVGAAGAGMEAAALGGWGAGLGAALPWIGGGLLAAGALGLFDRGGGPKASEVILQRDAAGFFIGNRNLPGSEANEPYLLSFRSALNDPRQFDPGTLAQFTNRWVGGAPGESAESMVQKLMQLIQPAREVAVQQLATQQALLREQERLNGTMQGLAANLEERLRIAELERFRDALAISEYVAPEQRFAAARELLERTYTGALGGDLGAVEAFPGVVQSALGIGRDVFASGPQFQALFLEANAKLQDILERQRQAQIDIMKDLPGIMLQTGADTVGAIRDQTRTLAERMSAVEDAIQRLPVHLAA